MRILLALAVLATLGWGGFWVVGARALDRAVGATLQGNPGFAASDHQVRGFPNRFDLTLTEPRLTLPDIAWQAPFVQLFALSYRPHHLIAVFPHDQGFTVQGIDGTLTTTDMRASLVMRPETTLPLERAALVAQGPSLNLGGLTHQADVLRLASRPLAADRHELAMEAEVLFLDPALWALLDPSGQFPRRIDALRLQGEVALSAPLDRRLLDGALPALSDLVLTGLSASWEGVDIAITGDLRADPAGRATGDVVVAITGWPRLLAQLQATGTELPPMAIAALRAMADPATPERVEVPLRLRAGLVQLGAFSLLELPPLF